MKIFEINLEEILVAYKIGRITLKEAVWIIKKQKGYGTKRKDIQYKTPRKNNR